MRYRKPRVERCINDNGLAPGWVVIVDRGGYGNGEAFTFDTWTAAMKFANAWARLPICA